MLAQLPTPAPGTIENWLVPAAAVASMFLLFKKLFPRKPSPVTDQITRAELQQETLALRDKIDARFLTLAEKLEHLGASLHQRLTQIEATTARLDERTKTL